ncbi:MAG: bifunctional folylpolyglutamate synthase/dihydrofolate synthase [Clostridia bacterium]|nr:bifunctional folylpolyglutamate synthase/dihydrofolate synthase [Clostridia bacterium]
MYDYKQILKDIHAHGRFSGTPCLDRMRALLAAVGNPQKMLKFVHIAGTNGKGSTAVLSASALQNSGYKTGLFTSPFVMDFCERICINGTNIPRDDLCRIAAQVLEVERSLHLPEGESIGEFEFTTACAMLYFAEQECDIVVLEVGLGGRYDATNVIHAPEVTVMVHVALDHMAVLGNTVEEIAADKSHVIKNGSVLVNYPKQQASVDEILRKRCYDVSAAYVKAPVPEVGDCTLQGTDCVIDGKPFHLRLTGRHQADNAATAYAALQILRDKGWNIPDEAIAAGFAEAIMPARQEVIQTEPLLMIDGAHNVDGVTALCETLDCMLPAGGISLVLGMVSDKQYESCIRMLVRRADAVYAVQPEGPRALSSRELASMIREFSPYTNVFDCGDVVSALKRALRSAEEEDAVIVCGSLYVAGEAKNALKAGII